MNAPPMRLGAPVPGSLEGDIVAIESVAAAHSILQVVCRTTGMGFAAIARVTEDRWIACCVQDDIGFGLKVGGELPVETTLCHEVRCARDVVVIDNVSTDPVYAEHRTPHIYGFQSYISVPIVRRDGTFFGTLCAIDPKPRHLNTPEIVGMFTLFADLLAYHLEAGARLAMGEQVRRNLALATGVLAASPDCVMVLSLEGMIEFMNARGLELNQIDAGSEVLGRDFAALWPAGGQAAVRDAIRRAALGQSTHLDGFCPTARGEPRWWEVRFARFEPEGGGAAKLLGVSRDISGRVQADDELRRTAEQLQELNGTLEDRVFAEVQDRLRAEEALRQSQKLEAVGQLTGGVAHDFNNLLTVIRSSADLLRTRDLSPERRKRYVDAISDTADRAAKLTGQLLAFSRRQALKAEVFDAAVRVNAISDMLRTVLGGRVQLAIEARCSARCFVDADAGQFETAVVNLAVNARDAMDGEGRLSLVLTEHQSIPPLRGHAAAQGAFIALSVADSGGGIAPEHLDHIFEPFFTTKEIGKGTGLGLSQVFGFAKQSGGDVEVLSRPGEGTTFRIYLPRAAVPADIATASTVPAVFRGGRVLVVEDNAQVGEFATQLLADLGFEPKLARNAAAALAALEDAAGRFDVMFSDVVMPGMSGVDLGRQVSERWPAVAVVLTSGYSHILAEDARHGFTLLNKPYSVEALSRVLSQAIAGAR